MTFKIWPNEFERKDFLTDSEKRLLRTAKKNFYDGHMVASIDPLGLSNKDVKMGMLVMPKEGLLTYSIIDRPFSASEEKQYITFVKYIEDRIYERLLDAKVLIQRNDNYKFLKFPYKHVLLFPTEKAINHSMTEEMIRELSPYILFGFFGPIDPQKKIRMISDLNLLSSVRVIYSKDFVNINDIEQKAIFERLAPEYTIVLPEKEEIEIKKSSQPVSEEMLKINGKEQEFRTFFLDDYQVGIVNDMGRGHRVILANPGAGKSVLLLSKAFKYASIYKESRVLLTCYNNNLSDAYQFKRSCANFGDNKNLFIMTFHKLVKKLYEECLHEKLRGNIAEDEEIDKCIELIKENVIKLRFKAIFIDEAQIFTPKYLELCYLLLESATEGTFLLAGDLNQTVRSQSRRGDAPWKKMSGIKLDFTGRVRYIEKNYRNTYEIASYIQNMLNKMNERLDMLGVIDEKEFEYDVFALNNKKSTALIIKLGITRDKITEIIIESIKEIINKYKVSYNEIAVIFPYKQMKYLKYYPLHWITTELNNQGIPYSLIIQDSGKESKTRYSDTNGIILTTIDSSLGLDFKAVIVTGLFPYNYAFRENGDNLENTEIKSWSQISRLDEDYKELIKIQMRKMYTACSRARDILYILSDLKKNTPMEEILSTKGGTQ